MHLMKDLPKKNFVSKNICFPPLTFAVQFVPIKKCFQDKKNGFTNPMVFNQRSAETRGAISFYWACQNAILNV